MAYQNQTNASNTNTVGEAQMSFFNKPITNKVPLGTVSLFEVYQYVHGRQALPETRELRSISDEAMQRQFKTSHFDYVTPSGIFTYCNDNGLVKHSGLLCMDLDDLDDVRVVKQKLLDDPSFETLLLFRSPRGNGLKWFVGIDLTRCDHRMWFTAVRNYLMQTYHLTEKQVDPQCINVSRACFLAHDEEVYLKTELIEYF